jgi:hypothetical protein
MDDRISYPIMRWKHRSVFFLFIYHCELSLSGTSWIKLLILDEISFKFFIYITFRSAKIVSFVEYICTVHVNMVQYDDV